MAQIIYRYFKKELPEGLILVRINPVNLEGLELLVSKEGALQQTARQFDQDIYDDLEYDEFAKGSALEFNLYLKGIKPDK
ncbi:MAG TPA: hypothetical protein ENJ39_08630 [Flammeovirgaceae bacterium]|nr:hypothetical protein [Flammeovirgaceae bacterium]